MTSVAATETGAAKAAPDAATNAATLARMQARQVNPWGWIPSLYFVQGLPYVVVMTLSVIMYKNLGLSNEAIALYTSWL